MAQIKKKTVFCKLCDFPFEIAEHLELPFGCPTPSYCEGNQENPRNRFKPATGIPVTEEAAAQAL